MTLCMSKGMFLRARISILISKIISGHLEAAEGWSWRLVRYKYRGYICLRGRGGGSTRQNYQICDVKYLNIKLGRPNFNHSTFTIFISTVFFQNSFITVITRWNSGKPIIRYHIYTHTPLNTPLAEKSLLEQKRRSHDIDHGINRDRIPGRIP